MFRVGPTRNQQRRRSAGTAAGIAFDVSVLGIDGLTELMAALPQTIRNGILKPMVERIAATGAKLAKANVARMLPKRDPKTRRWDRPTGALRDAMGSNVMPLSKMRNKSLVFGLFGARRDFKVTKQTAKNIASIRQVVHIGGRKTLKAGPLDVGRSRPVGKRMMATRGAIQPSKYIHLVEGGHRGSFYFPSARPYPFMATAKATLQGMLPQIVGERWSTLYPQQVAKLTRRYMKQAGVSSSGGTT